MRNLPHHLKKLNRQIIRDARREALEENLPELPTWPETERQRRKKAKAKVRTIAKNRPSSKKTKEERNLEMKRGRTPIFDQHSAKPKHTRPTHKKTPKI